MTETEPNNLIDFSAEDLILIHTPPQNDDKPRPSADSASSDKEIQNTPSILARDVCDTSNLSTSLLVKHDSLDNNPFDVVQKMACRPSDPFDIVEKEACQKALSLLPPVEVKEGTLLSLSSESIPNNSVGSGTKDSKSATIDVKSCSTFSGEETPTSTLNKFIPDSQTDVDSASSTELSSGTKTKKPLEYRKRLLKLSLSNSTCNSPLTTSEYFADENSTISLILSEAAQLGENLLFQESPIKLVDDDLESVEPNKNTSQQNYEDDLEMLKVKIPELRETIAPAVDEQLASKDILSTESKHKLELKQKVPLTDLAAIRAKLKAKTDLSSNKGDLSLLIGDLRKLIADINVGDTSKKEQAANLLDTLSAAVTENKIATNTTQTEPQSESINRPHAIIRQKTFDIELKESTATQKLEIISPNACSPNCDIPDIMLKSSATYDGESNEENQYIHLPEIRVDGGSPAEPPPQPQPSELDINDIVEQLGKILEQHQLNNMDDGSPRTNTMNPTFIVVMNTPQTSLASAVNKIQNRKSLINDSFNEAPCPDSKQHSDAAMRRRSQSLSIHDKIKIVHLPLVQTTAVPASKTTPTITDREDIQPPPIISVDKVPHEFKTPSRMLRRNSFSNVTPCSSRYSNYTAQRRVSGISNIQKQSSSVLKTHHEQGDGRNSSISSSAVVCQMQNLNLNSINAQLTNKKRIKSSASDSILKSSAPMKATIPVKKVAPMMKTPPCVGVAKKTRAATCASTDVLAKSSKISSTSSHKMTLSHLGGMLDVSNGFPNACSTPTVHTSSPFNRSSHGATAKSRYSYLSSTPNIKLPTNSAATAGARRRTIGVHKAKSPIKPRLSSFGVPESAATPSHSSTVKKLPITSKPVNKSTSIMYGTSTRSSPRPSFGGAAPHRNKENKHP